MTHLITVDSLPSFVAKQAGGKGASLHQLARAGFNVPAFAIVPASAFARFIDTNHIDIALDDASAIRATIEASAFPADVERAIRACTLSFPIAVRSSALDEDGASASFAGAHDTFLFVENVDDALRAVRSCWASAFSDRAVSYRRERALPPVRGIAVVLQEMVDADASAVVFTCDPVSGDRAKTVINAANGVGEKLVSGQVDPDTITIARGTNAIESRSGPRILGDDLVKKIVDVANRIEAFANKPQDIELAIENGEVFVLQARPVTTSIANESGRLQLWDNANIVESYGGLTLPLTFDFARYVYRQVYVQFCEILLVPKAQLASLEKYLRNMLGILNGRIYYNILNWYRLTSILPGFKYNRRFMEQMMGTHHALGDSLADEVRSMSSDNALVARVRRFVVGLSFVWHHFTIGKRVDQFIAHFDEKYAEYRAIEWTKLDASDVQDKWHDIERALLHRWHAPIINDYLCMVHFGVLRALCTKWMPHKGEGFVGELMSGVGDLQSHAPAKELAAIAREMDAKARFVVENTANDECMEALRREQCVDTLARIETFIGQYGHRCMDEMKLEAHDLFEDPSYAFTCLKNLLRANPNVDVDDAGRVRRERAESELRSLSWWKRAIFGWSLQNARRAVRNRESTRLCRTRIYGVVRAMMRALGQDFARRGLIQSADDIFYLRLDEVFGVLDGTLAAPNHAHDVIERKKLYATYAAVPAPARLESRGVVYGAKGKHVARTVDDSATTSGAHAGDATNELRGTPCAPGVVEGVVRVVRGPEDATRLAGEILVAERTDPGWIPLYPSVSGLLVERGGLLSHSAIVARESGLPTIVGIDGLCARLQTGMRVRMSGATGVIEILDEIVDGKHTDDTGHVECIDKRAA